MSAALELVNVTKRYGSVAAVSGLTLEVPEGALFGLIGPNGAGKTTTFSLLSGFIRPTEGEVRVRGVRLKPGHPPLGRVLSLPQDAGMPLNMKALDVLEGLCRLGGASTGAAKDRSRRALERVGLEDAFNKSVGALSHGQRRRVGIASTLLGEDEVILLDEPTSGLDPRTAGEIRRLVSDLARDRTIVLSSHNLQEVETICTHAAILARGKLVSSGAMEELRGTRSLVRVTLTRPLRQARELETELMGQAGVESVAFADDGLAIDLRLGPNEDVEDLMSALLRIMLDRGASVGSVQRGKTLEQAFMEVTDAVSSNNAKTLP